MVGILSFCYKPLTGHDFVPSNISFQVWSNGDFSPCFEYVALDIPLQCLLGVASFVHAIRLHTAAARKRKPVHLLVRMFLSALVLLVALGELVGSFKMVKDRTISIVVSQSVRTVVWGIHIVCIYQMSRSVKHSGRGPLSLNFVWYLNLVETILRFRSMIRCTLYPAACYVSSETTPYFEELIRISVYAQIAVQALYAATLLFSADPVTGDNVSITEELPGHLQVSSQRERVGHHLRRTETLQESEREPLLSGASQALGEEKEENLEVGSTRSMLLHGGHQFGSHSKQAGYKLGELQVSQDNAGMLSKLVFWWVNPLMRRGALGLLEKSSDLPSLPAHLSTGFIREQFTRACLAGRSWWQVWWSKCFCSEPAAGEGNIGSSNSEEHTQRIEKSVSLLSVFNRAFGCHYYPLGVLKLMSDSLGFAGPLLLNALINFMENKSVSLCGMWTWGGGRMWEA